MVSAQREYAAGCMAFTQSAGNCTEWHSGPCQHWMAQCRLPQAWCLLSLLTTLILQLGTSDIQFQACKPAVWHLVQQHWTALSCVQA